MNITAAKDIQRNSSDEFARETEHTVPPEMGVNWFAAIIGLASFVAIQWKKLNIITVILVSEAMGLVRGLLF